MQSADDRIDDIISHIDPEDVEVATQSLSIAGALEALDAAWFSRLNPWRKDLIGDYAGSDLFVIDGDSLCQVVLDDPLLALGRMGDNSFQILHAIWILEKLLYDISSRKGNFEVVFFEGNQHLSLPTNDAAPFCVSSRTLARSVLKRHLSQLFSLHHFSGLEDDSWVDYVRHKRPMFVMCNEGGVSRPFGNGRAPSQNVAQGSVDSHLASTLAQRVFMFQVLSSGLSVVTLETVEFLESKIVSFVYTQRRGIPYDLPEVFLSAYALATRLLDTTNHQPQSLDHQAMPQHPLSLVHWYRASALHFIRNNSSESMSLIDGTLLYLFMVQAVLLPRLTLTERAQPLHPLNPKLDSHLQCEFLPQIFLSLNATLPHALEDSEWQSDVDGRVFLRLLSYFTSGSAPDLQGWLGSQMSSSMSELWASLEQESGWSEMPFDLVQLREQYPSPSLATTLQTPVTTTLPSTFDVLPFENPFFAAHLSKIRVTAASEQPPKKPMIPIKKPLQVAKDDWDDDSDGGSGSDGGDKDDQDTEVDEDETSTLVQSPSPDPSSLKCSKNFTISNRGLYKDDKPSFDGRKVLPPRTGTLGLPVVRPASGTSTSKPSPSLAWLRKKKERLQQRMAATVHREAESLTGAKGAKFRQQVITLTGVSVETLKMTDPYAPAYRKVTRPPTSTVHLQRNVTATGLEIASGPANPASRVEPSRPSKDHIDKKKGGKPGGKKAQALNSKNRLLVKIVEGKQKITTSDSERWWASMLKELDSLDSYERKQEFLQSLSRNKRLSTDSTEGEAWLPVEVMMFKLHLELDHWFKAIARDEDEIRISYTVKILILVKELWDLPGFYPSAIKLVRNLLKVLGHDQLYVERKPNALVEDRKISFSFIQFALPSNNHEADLIQPRYAFTTSIEGTLNFQLNHFGPYMDRSMDSKPDPRVSFEADGWQRKVLDKLDARESVLIIAPTSAGKTFISFYAMEQVLSESDDGILVYVSPSKALVNQVAGETSARFGKSLKSGTFWALDNGDYKVHNTHTAQIMVVAPQVLSEMLLNPALARTWAPRLRWIILDEIHCIGQQEGGAVWEQLILLAPCPIIGLSATIGNPNEFNAWLGAVQTHHGFSHSLIQHQHRYSHLRKFFYPLNEAPPKFERLDIAHRKKNLQFIHPVSVLETGIKSLPDDLALESRDCASLFNAMKLAVGQMAASQWATQLEGLDPHTFFASKGAPFLQQKDIIEYEVALKRVLSIWMSDPSSDQTLVQNVVKQLAMTYSPKDTNVPTEELVLENIAYLLAELHQRNDLPALLFNFDRKVCEKIGRAITLTLQNAQAGWRENSPEWKAKVASWEKWQSQAKAREKGAERRKNVKPPEGVGREELERSVTDQQRPWQDLFDPEDPNPQFSFASEKTNYSRQELKDDIEDLRYTGVAEWALYGLKIGVGVHHSGMGRRYRVLVERLFRIGFLRVVISTETLALGINAPCKTVIFVTDSPNLTALNYRQCAGRAGRRGFDLLGNVIFYGIPVDRVHGIIMSKVPPLTGSSPLTATLSLRLCDLLYGSGEAPYATKIVRSLLELPQLSVSSRTTTDENLYYFRFLLDYLRRDNMLDLYGQPKNIYPIVANLYDSEPSNLALSLLLRSGVIHRICSTIDSNPLETKRNLIHLLTHLFGRRVLPPVYLKGRTIESIRKLSASKVALSPLPDDAREFLQDQDITTLRRCKACVTAYATENSEKLGPDDVLPFSGATVNRLHPNPSPFINYLDQTANIVTALSRFVANSGETDSTISSVGTLVKTLRSGIHLNKYTVPSMELIVGHEGDLPVNAHIFDFFMHGQLETLIHVNRVKRSELWYDLKVFSHVVGTIQLGLEQLMRSSAGPDNPDDEEDEDGVGREVDTLDPEEYREEANQRDGAGDVSHVIGNTEGQGSDAFPRKPDTITQGDWNVYRAVVMTRLEFNEKFMRIWA